MVHLEIKVLLALQYCVINDYDLFNQLINSIQRQIRILGKDKCEHIIYFTKMLKIGLSEVKQEKAKKIEPLIEKFNKSEPFCFAPTKLVRLDEKFIDQLVKR